MDVSEEPYKALICEVCMDGANASFGRRLREGKPFRVDWEGRYSGLLARLGHISGNSRESVIWGGAAEGGQNMSTKAGLNLGKGNIWREESCEIGEEERDMGRGRASGLCSLR